jgi:hypothetical protein
MYILSSPNFEVFSAESLWARLKQKIVQKMDPMLNNIESLHEKARIAKGVNRSIENLSL